MNFSKSIYTPKNPQKYVGVGKILMRSSWETNFARFCDTNPAILKWAAEPMKIPYRNPLNGKQTVYVPDFFIQYIDKTGKKHAEVVEVKPANQTVLEQVGKSRYNQEQYVKNMAKWEAANAWCKQQGIRFRVVNENEIFHQGPKRR